MKKYDPDFNFQRRVRELRAEAKLTQEIVSSKIGVTRSAYGSYEEGRAVPDIQIMLRICNFYRLTLDEFVRGEKPERKPFNATELTDIQKAYNQAPDDKRDIVDYILRIGMHSVI